MKPSRLARSNQQNNARARTKNQSIFDRRKYRTHKEQNLSKNAMVFSEFYSKKAKKVATGEKHTKRKVSTFKDVKPEFRPKKKSRHGIKNKPFGTDASTFKQKSRPENKPRFHKPSEEALQLSEKLKLFSKNKNLDGALKEYWSKSNDAFRDGHHACIVVDCSARCGNIKEGEKIVEYLRKSHKHVNIETKTALLKGYVHSGEIAKAEKLFVSMCESKAKKDLPNTRSFNTLLRGCLWCAASVDQNDNVTGGVVTCEKAWNLFQDLQKSGSVSSGFDVSSFEYSISLLCQALKTEAAENRIKELKVTFLDESKDPACVPQSVSEALAISYLALARAYAILYQREQANSACNLAIDFANKSRKALLGKDITTSLQHGKRGKNLSTSRTESNVLYREHRLSEIKNEAEAISDILDKSEESPNPRQLCRRLLLRLVVLAGGGTTDDEYVASEKSGTTIQGILVNTAYFNFGLDTALENMGMTLDNSKKTLRKKDCNRILGHVGLQGGVVHDNGIIDFRRIFKAGTGKVKKRSKKARPMVIELGSGFGDWIVKQAMTNPEIDFISVELRADRVGQTFARTAILSSSSSSSLENLCIVGAESGSFLTENVQNESVSTIYINHPEPPTQTFGAEVTNLEAIMDGEKEPAHMLSSRTLVAAANCLTNSPESKIVIVTDNKWYGRLICATLVRIRRKHPNLLHSFDCTKYNYETVETFDEGVTKVSLFQGQPDESIGYSRQEGNGKGVSYFDRLWRTGAGSHAEKRSRFIIVMTKLDK